MSRSVVVTGASTGIGRACALDLDRRGWRVFATVRSPADAQSLKAEASANLNTLYLDVTDADSIRAAAAEVSQLLGGSGLDGLVNNAGIALAGPLEFMPIDAIRRQLEVNVVGQLAVTQAFLPLLRRNRGRIVMMGSIAGKSVVPLVGAYGAAKHALEAVTDALRMELGPAGIEVSIIEPGSVATPIWKKGTDQINEMGAEREQVERHYGWLINAIRNRLGGTGDTGVTPQAVADVTHHALAARRPKTRYLVGRMAWMRYLASRLPDRWADRLLLRILTR
jgi:NAD(P)-dependent dehydrogenase (short-subunit alcohol dehydrogenase family)